MRAILLTLVACMLLATSVAAIDAQASARAVETRWKNCSQINRGRLGALHDVDDNQINAMLHTPQWSVANSTYSNPKVTFYPCTGDANGHFVTFQTQYGIDSPIITNFDVVYTDAGQSIQRPASTASKLLTFTMPDTAAMVPMVTMTFSTTTLADAIKLSVIVQCDAASTGNVTFFQKVDASNWKMTINSVEACARFPYTNEAVPAGGVAAIIVCVLCFVFEFLACAKYHRDNKNHSPLDEESMR